MEDFAALAPTFVEEAHRGRLEKVADRDLELERKIIELSKDFTDMGVLGAKAPIGHTEKYPPTHDSEKIKEEELTEFI